MLYVISSPAIFIVYGLVDECLKQPVSNIIPVYNACAIFLFAVKGNDLGGLGGSGHTDAAAVA